MKRLLVATLLAGAGLAFLSCAVQAQDKKWTEVRIVTEGGFVPWNYTKPDGTLAGFEVDLAMNLCSRMHVKCTIAAQSFDSMIPALNAGKFDAIVDDLAITPKREEVISFSVPYAALCETFGTMKDSDIAKQLSSDDQIIPVSDAAVSGKALESMKRVLKDKTIGTLSSGTSVDFINAYFSGTSQIRQYKTPEARDLDLLSGRLDAIVGSKDALLGTAAKAGGNIAIAGTCFQGGVLGKGSGVGLRKADTELKAMFDKAIREAQADGTIKKLSEATFHMDVTPRQ
ncbi:transporter substrate-binding domain-containing protein [Paraburkholderia sediminicola]|uniref:transporter substrate-binding domain-containing protein n=1 Tax=Paraburkholderia sediminicola TaxID=458836 RepID=UPI000E753A58